MAERRLGRGLGSLLGATPTSTLATREAIRGVVAGAPATGEEVARIPVEAIYPSRSQPRRTFDLETIEELAASLEAHGLLQPITVCPDGTGRYELIAGERRWRAAVHLGWETIPALQRSASELERLELALIENLQREDLNPMDRAEAFRTLVDSFGLSHEQVSSHIGKSRSALTNLLRLLELPEDIQDMVRDRALTEGHARTLLGLDSDEERRQLADRIHTEDLSVRATEQIVKASRMGKAAAASRRRSRDARSPQVKQMEEQLARLLGTRVRIQPGARGGKIIVEYYSNEDFERLLARIRS